LAYRNAVELTHARWKSDIQVLVRALRPYMEIPVVTAPGSEAAGPAATDRTAARQASAATNEFGLLGNPLLDRRELERVTRQLATYVGPIANVMVKRASKDCGSIAELCLAVSREIVSETDRVKFLRSCRS
jgi:hypothetical protein